MVELRHYLTTPEGAVGIVTRRSNAQNDTRYWFKDHLGSIVAITGGAGVVKQRFTYDPWGKRRTAYNADPSAEERGFTGHEHLVEAGLIHMNGRLYFDALGRMLQADPIIQAPYDGQNYDRYAYVFNNPLSLIDPTGYSSLWVRTRAPVAAIIMMIATYGAASAAWTTAVQGAAAAGTVEAFAGTMLMTTNGTLTATGAMVVGAAGGFAAGGLSSGNIEGALQGALTGAAFGALNFGIGDITTGAGNIFGDYATAANIALHAVVGCAQSAAAGGSCKGGAASGGFSAAAGAVGLGGGVVGRAVVGAMASKLAGGRAGDGAMVAVFDYLFNECAHTRMCGTGQGGYDSSDTPSGQLLRHIDASSGCVATSAGGPSICFGIGGIAAAGRAIVIGEGMEAIKAAALALRGEGVGAKWYQAWGKNFPEGRLMTAEELEVALARNARWIEAKIRAGYKIYDIGIDATRATRSPFYELERAILKKFNYETIPMGR
ncbi:tRNA3(Ser)-specific nuclease WapA [Burkholderiales bacterium]|nr:tRNA3(Ser)-specific nuclease WapA [Burkholderiales bacterium]